MHDARVVQAATNLFQHTSTRQYLAHLWATSPTVRDDYLLGGSVAGHSWGIAHTAARCFQASPKLQLSAATALYNLSLCLHEASTETRGPRAQPPHTDSSPASMRRMVVLLGRVLKSAPPGAKATTRLLQAQAAIFGATCIRCSNNSMVDGSKPGAVRSLRRLACSQFVATSQALAPSNPQASTFLKHCADLL